MKPKVLIVDDKSELRTLLSSMLKNKFEIETSGNGAEAMAVLEGGFIPDVIVSDLMMPGVDGKAFITQLKASGLYREIPVIVLSSIDKSMERVELFRMGVSDYLIKPFNPLELTLRIEKLIKS